MWIYQCEHPLGQSVSHLCQKRHTYIDVSWFSLIYLLFRSTEHMRYNFLYPWFCVLRYLWMLPYFKVFTWHLDDNILSGLQGLQINCHSREFNNFRNQCKFGRILRTSLKLTLFICFLVIYLSFPFAYFPLIYLFL